MCGLKSVYTEQKYKRNTFVFAPIFHEYKWKIEDFFLRMQ